MKHRVKLNVMTREKGPSGAREVVRKKTFVVSGKKYRRILRRKWNEAVGSEAERLAALAAVWEVDKLSVVESKAK